MSKFDRAIEIYNDEGIYTLVEKGGRYYSTQIYNSVTNRMRYLLDNVVTRYRGRYLFDHDWDLAIILDACRYELGCEFCQNNQIGLGCPEKIYSVGSTSKDWINRTFTNASVEKISGTAYISANPFTDEVPHQIGYLDKVYRYAWEEELGTVPPRPVTDRTIKLMRDNTAARYIAHFMQPHLPSLKPAKEYEFRWEPAEGLSGNITEGYTSPWNLARSGEDQQIIVQNYRNNLHPVLDEVQLLLENVDASKVIITADHGNYLGEKGRWAHPGGHIHPAVRHVPWWETTANDENTHSPATYDKKADVRGEEQLEALGYR